MNYYWFSFHELFLCNFKQNLSLFYLSENSNTSSSTASTKTTSATIPSSFPSFKSDGSSPPTSLKSFTLNDLKAATKNFRSDSYLGEGGFGIVFKGWIDENSYAPTKPGVGIVVAIKKLKRESFQGHKEWLVCSNVHRFCHKWTVLGFFY